MFSLISRIFLFCFVFVSVFDPADKIVGLKMPLFLCCIALGLFHLIAGPKSRIEYSSLATILIFLIVPMIAVLNGIIFFGQDGQLGFMMYKGYLLILLLPVLCIMKIDILPVMSFTLILLAALVVVTYIFVNAFPESYIFVREVGNLTGLVLPDRRNYGGDSDYLQIYYVTSPMLVIAIAYYFSLATNKKEAHPIRCSLATFICILAMILAGTRNNLFVALLLPASLFFFNSKYKSLFFPLLLTAGLLSLSLLWSVIGELLNPNEYSNSLKLGLVHDYVEILSNPLVLIFGQGLGVDIYWPARGHNLHLSELTYFEMIRNFGLLGSLFMLMALLSPIYKLMRSLRVSKIYKNIVLGYGFYLLMCFTNPNLFSSMGILILVSLLAYYFINFRALK